MMVTESDAGKNLYIRNESIAKMIFKLLVVVIVAYPGMGVNIEEYKREYPYTGTS